MTDYEAALKAARERVKRCVHLAYGEADITTALADLVALAKAVGAMENIEPFLCTFGCSGRGVDSCQPHRVWYAARTEADRLAAPYLEVKA